MSAIALRPRFGAALRSRGVELAWAAFAAACCVAMILAPRWETLPYYLAWVSLAVVYGFRVWPLPAALVTLTAVMAATAGATLLDPLPSIHMVRELLEIPLTATMFLVMVWHARRRVAALRVAEGRSEERRSLLERQERFIHDASHELKTPVTIARGHLELLQGQCGGEPEFEVALDELGRIDAIIERLLLLATADQPDFLRFESLELEPFLEDVFMRWSEVAPRAWRLGPLAAGRLEVDPDRLRAALDALIENAVKFTPECGVIELQARAAGRDEIAIEVRDEGRGVPQEALGRIFHRFARADAARTRSAGGVGLGLAIVDAIAKGHGGQCTVRSTAAGSTFALVLPGFAPAARPITQPPVLN